MSQLSQYIASRLVATTRKAKGLSQAEAAKAIGITVPMLNRFDQAEDRTQPQDLAHDLKRLGRESGSAHSQVPDLPPGQL